LTSGRLRLVGVPWSWSLLTEKVEKVSDSGDVVILLLMLLLTEIVDVLTHRQLRQTTLSESFE
jgi:hypothetical protein